MVKRPVAQEDAGRGNLRRRRSDSGTLSAQSSENGDANPPLPDPNRLSPELNPLPHLDPDGNKDLEIDKKSEADAISLSDDSCASDASSASSSCADDPYDDFAPYSPPGPALKKDNLDELSSDSEVDPSEIENDGIERDQLLYHNSCISVNESMLSILTLALAHHLSGACLDHILQLIALHCPEPNLCKKTFRTFKKHFAKTKTHFVRHYYCTTCFESLRNKEDICGQCKEQRGVAHFIGVSIPSQLEVLYKRQGFRQQLKHRFNRSNHTLNNYEDIYDGKIYKSLCADGNILADPNNISFTWHTGAVRLFRSSSNEVWPFYLTINELPYSERYKAENVILGGIWFGSCRPVPQLFLKEISEDLHKLNRGIQFKLADVVDPIFVRGVVLCGTCDLPAKALFLNMSPHNNSFGCQKCKVRSTKENNRAVYKFERFPKMRSHQETLIHAQKALNLRRSVFGVRGQCPLTFVYHPVETTAIDMHDAYLGVCKILNKAHFSEAHHKHPASLFGFLELYDRRLCALRPPYYVQSTPRSFSEHGKVWEATELKVNLMIYSLPLLQDIMSVYHFEHHMLLVYGLYLLSKDSVSDKCIKLASELLTDYCSRFEDLYGNEFMSCHVHQLIHLPSVVRDFGPLWVTSSAPYESVNATLQKFVHGSQNEEMQISSTVSLFLNISRLKAARPNSGRPVHAFLEKLSSNRKRLEVHQISGNFCAVGKFKSVRVLPELVYVALAPLKLTGKNFYLFDKVLNTRKNMIFATESCDTNTNRFSACVKYQKNNGTFFGIVKSFVRVTDCLCVDLCQNCGPLFYAIIQKFHVQPAYRAEPGGFIPFIHRCADLNEYEAIKVECLTYVCFLIEVIDRHDAFIVEPINTCRVD